MAERRTHERFLTKDIRGGMILASRVDILNLSLSGASIECDRRLNLGSKYAFKFKDPKRAITIEGTVVWSILGRSAKTECGENVPLYRAGVQFSDVLTDKARTLIDLIDSHKKIDESRLSGRFGIKPAIDAFLDYPFDFRTRKIGLDGLVIESEHELSEGKEFPMQMGIGEKTFRFIGKVVSCSSVADSSPVSYLLKIDFVGITDDNREILKEVIESVSATEGE